MNPNNCAENILILGKNSNIKSFAVLHTQTETYSEQNAATQTFVEVSITERLQDAVHCSHVEQETQLSDRHGHQTEHEDGADDSFQEWLGCRGEQKRESAKWCVCVR